MTLIPKNDVNQIFASQAPEQDKPAAFNNYLGGWGVESRPNNGKPTIKGFNKLQQRTDENILYIHQSGAALPFDENMEYAENAVVVKNGVLQQWKGGAWAAVSEQELKNYLLAAGIDEAELDTEYNYLMQRLAQITVDKGLDASFVTYVGLTQKQINDGVESIADLVAIKTVKAGMRVFVKSFHPNLNLGGGDFIAVENVGLAEDGILVFASRVDIVTGKQIGRAHV